MREIHLTQTIPHEMAGLRLDQAIAKLYPEFSRSRIQGWIMTGQILVDGAKLRAKDRVIPGQHIVITATIADHDQWQAQPIPLNIVYEDQSLIIVNKPIGLVVHPGAGNPDQTLVNALLHYDPSLSSLPRAGILHRLDKNTSGLLIVARNIEAYTYLTMEMQNRKIKREYEAIVNGLIISGGTIDAPIARHPSLRTKMAVIINGKPAITHYRVLQRFRAHTHLALQLETGRTHQIRVHLSSIHHPIVGDTLYGGRLKLPPQATEELSISLREYKHQALHAKRISLIHPATKELHTWESPLPNDMQALLSALEHDTMQNADV